MTRSIVFAAVTTFALTAVPAAADSNKIERIMTPGGIEIWHVHDQTLPLISLEFAFLGGAAQDPSEKPGVANLVASLLDEGAGELDATAFKERLEGRAIRFSFNAQRDTLRGSLKTLSEHGGEAFDLLRLALTEPRFDDAAVERVRARVLSDLRRRASNPNDVAGEHWFANAFPDHPYGRPVRGTLDSVASVTVDDLHSYHDKTLARANLKIAAVSPLDAKDLAAYVDRAFGGLPEDPELVPVADVSPQGLGTRAVVDFDVPQTVIIFGGLGLKRDDPDFIPAYVLNHVLGGGSFSSRLYREVREKRGLAYSVYSYLAPYRHTGLFLGGVATRNERAAQTLDIIMEEIERIASEGPTADELAKAKSFLVGSFPLRFDTSGKLAGQLLEIQLEDLGIDYIDRRNGLIEAVTAEDVRRAAARYLTDAPLFVTMVGRPDLPPAEAGRG